MNFNECAEHNYSYYNPYDYYQEPVYDYDDYTYCTTDYNPDFACDATYYTTQNIPLPNESAPHVENNCDDQDFQKEQFTQKPK